MRILVFTFIVGFIYGAPTAPEAGLCEVCHLLVGEVQDLLTTTQTQDSVSSYISDACAKLPSEEKDVCNRFMKDYSGSLFSRLIKDLTPHEFCEGLTDVCPAYSEQPEADLVEEADDPSANPLECELCKLAVLGIDRLIKQNRSSAAINDTLEKFCNGLSDKKIKDVCIKIEPAILKGLTAGFEPSVACKFATLCSVEGSDEFSEIPCDVCYTVMDAIGVADAESVCASKTSCVMESEVQRKHEEISEPEVEDTLECQICKFAVQAVDTIVGENRSASTINQTLENLCNSLPGELKDSCLNVEPDILKAIKGGIDPTKSCDFVKFCNDEGKVPLSSQYLPCDVCKETLEGVAGEKGVQICYQFKDVCGLEQEPVLEEDVENVAVPYDQYTMGEEELENVKEDARCELCKFMIQLLDESLEKNATLTQINNTLYGICAVLPEQIRALCPAIIPQVEAAFAAGLDPTNTCIASSFCTETSRLVSIEEFKCETCAQFVESLPERTAIKVKNGICNGACHKRNRRSAEQESPLLYEMEAVMKKAKDLKGISECELCKVFVSALDGLAGENASVETVNKTVYEICTRLTGIQLQQACLNGAPKLAQLLQKGLNPDKTCVAAKFCTDETPVKIQKRSIVEDKESALMSVIKEKERHNVGDLACDVCEGVIELLDQLVKDNATDNEINQTLYRICSGLPDGAFKDVCLKDAPQIMTAVEKGFDPKTTCTDVGLCTGSSKVRNRVQLRKKVIHEKETKANNLDSAVLKLLVTKQKTQNNVGTVECDLCEIVLQLLDQELEDNATDEKINQTLYSLCSGLPIEGLKELCTQSVVPAIMSVVKQGLDPETTCTNIGLCNGQRQKKKSQKLHKQVKDIKPDREIPNIEKEPAVKKNGNLKDLKCELCKEIIQELDVVIKQNASAEKINETLYNLCADLPGALKDLCLNAAPQILKELIDGVDPTEACDKIGFCSSNAKTSFNKKVDIKDLNNIFTNEMTNVGDAKCEICELLVQELESLVGQNSSDQKINDTIYGLCNQLPSGLEQKYCLLVAPTVVTELEKGQKDPHACCVDVKLCTSSGDELTNEIIENVGDEKCTICEMLVQELKNVIGQNASDEKINTTIFDICNQIPNSSTQKYCVLVAPNVVTELEKREDPQGTCTDVKLCTSSGQRQKKKSQKLHKQIKDIKSDREIPNIEKEPTVKKNGNLKDLKCDVCKTIIKGLDVVIKQNASTEKINETLYSVCADLPGALKDLCLNAAPQILQALLNGVDPTEACDKLDLCSSNAETSFNKQEDIKDLNNIFTNEMTNVGDAKCEICELLVQELESLVGQNSSDQKINDTIYGLCNQLPSGLEQKYCLLVAPTVVTELEKGQKDPHACCVDVKLCTSSVDELENTELTVGDVKCDICELIIQGIDTLVGQNASAKKINDTIYTVCGELPGAAQTFCNNLAPTIVQEIEGGVSPAQACTVLKLCSSSAQPVLETRANVGDIKCELCELVIRKVDGIVGKNASKEKINSTVYELCDKMNLTKKISCLLIAPGLVKEIEAGADPQKACENLKLCTYEAPSRDAISEVRKAPIDCNICARSLTAVYEDISGNYMKVKRRLLQICNNLPVIFQDACESLVQKDNGRLFKKVLGNYTPTALCEMAKCQENEGPMKNHSF